jgi:anaerobic ribonucleoside-triphosphate reductase activating protein
MLNVAAWEPRSVANGPGPRFVLWVQGCPFRCQGCFNQDFLEFRPAREHSVEELAGMILSHSGLEGVTYSGGEPMSQARGLYSLSRILREAGLSVFSYSGYTLAELERRSDPWIRRFLGTIDILVDGRFEQERRANLVWRGSSNQRVHFLTDRYRHLADDLDTPGAAMEFIIRDDGFTTTGILDQEFLGELAATLRQGSLSINDFTASGEPCRLPSHIAADSI